MAILKHFSSKNADYGAAEKYLLFQHDEFTIKPVLDETGRLIPREDYTAANATNQKKPISRRARPFSDVTATRQSATASGQPVRNGKPPRSSAATLKRWNG